MRKAKAQYTGSREFLEAFEEYCKNSKMRPRKAVVSFADLEPTAWTRAKAGKRIFEPEKEKLKIIANRIGFKGDVTQPLNEK